MRARSRWLAPRRRRIFRIRSLSGSMTASRKSAKEAGGALWDAVLHVARPQQVSRSSSHGRAMPASRGWSSRRTRPSHPAANTTCSNGFTIPFRFTGAATSPTCSCIHDGCLGVLLGRYVVTTACRAMRTSRRNAGAHHRAADGPVDGAQRDAWTGTTCASCARLWPGKLIVKGIQTAERRGAGSGKRRRCRRAVEPWRASAGQLDGDYHGASRSRGRRPQAALRSSWTAAFGAGATSSKRSHSARTP